MMRCLRCQVAVEAAAIFVGHDAIHRKSVEAPNWMKAKEPRDVRLVMELIAQVRAARAAPVV